LSAGFILKNTEPNESGFIPKGLGNLILGGIGMEQCAVVSLALGG
jgi:hypothetical protein